jgi:hypothetical protein
MSCPTTRRRFATLVHPAPSVTEMTCQPMRHPPLVLSLGSPPVRQPADILLLFFPPPSCGDVLFFKSTFFFTVVPTFNTFHFSFVLLGVWSGFAFITAGGYLPGGLQDANFSCRTETLKMSKVCSPLLLRVFLLPSRWCSQPVFLFPTMSLLDLMATDTQSAQVARISSFFHVDLLPPS